MARHTSAAVGGWPGQRQFFGQAGRRRPLRSIHEAPACITGADCGSSVFSRSDELSCHGTDVTIMFGLEQQPALQPQRALVVQHLLPPVPDDVLRMNTVTTVRGDSLRPA